MTFEHHDLRRTLLLACGLLIACTPTPVQLDTNTTGSASDASGGTTTASTSGPDTLDGTSGSADGTESSGEETGPSFDPVCGDGIVEDPEQCDLGDLNGEGMYCTDECTSNVCGDGYAGPGEACDDGNDNDNDQCTSECGLATCGDGALQGAEECDEGENNSQTGSCLPSCILPTCGDLFIQAGVEMCDGNNNGGETCATQGFDRGVLLCNGTCDGFDTSNCHDCGNGVIEPSENCDTPDFAGLTCTDFAPGGTTPSGGALACIDSCMTVDDSACTYCGDNVLEGTETCDGTELAGETCVTRGYGSGTLGCLANCTDFDESGCDSCNNNVLDAGEQCDMANFGPATCTTVEGTGYRGALACNADCTIDSTGCCLADNEECMFNTECCSGTCANDMGTLRCEPL